MSMENMVIKLQEVNKLNTCIETLLQADDETIKELNFEAKCRLMSKFEDNTFKD